MNTSDKTKAIVCALIATAGATLAASTSAQAQPLFPPAHHAGDAAFSETPDVPRDVTVGSWYRPRASVPVVMLDAPAGGREVYVVRDSRPWYRAVN